MARIDFFADLFEAAHPLSKFFPSVEALAGRRSKKEDNDPVEDAPDLFRRRTPRRGHPDAKTREETRAEHKESSDRYRHVHIEEVVHERSFQERSEGALLVRNLAKL